MLHVVVYLNTRGLKYNRKGMWVNCMLLFCDNSVYKCCFKQQNVLGNICLRDKKKQNKNVKILTKIGVEFCECLYRIYTRMLCMNELWMSAWKVKKISREIISFMLHLGISCCCCMVCCSSLEKNKQTKMKLQKLLWKLYFQKCL